MRVFPTLIFGSDIRRLGDCAARLSVRFKGATQAFVDLGGIKHLAVMLQADPLSAELAFRDDHFKLGRKIQKGAFESLDFGPSVEVEGEKVH